MMMFYLKGQPNLQKYSLLKKIIVSVVLLALFFLCAKLIHDNYQEKNMRIGSYYPPDIIGWNRVLYDNRKLGPGFGFQVIYTMKGKSKPVQMQIITSPKNQSIQIPTAEHRAKEYVDVMNSLLSSSYSKNVTRLIKNDLRPVKISGCYGYETSTTYIVRGEDVISSKNLYISGKDGVYEFQFKFNHRYGNEAEAKERKKIMDVAWENVVGNLKDMCES